MDEVHYHMYHQSKKSIVDLPPTTSHMTAAHILRAFYGTYIQHHCISGLQLNADRGVWPVQNHVLLPNDFPY